MRIFFNLQKAIKPLGKEGTLPLCRQIRGKTNRDETCESRTQDLNPPQLSFRRTVGNRQNPAPRRHTDCKVRPGKIWARSKCFLTTIFTLTSKIDSTFKKSAFALDLEKMRP